MQVANIMMPMKFGTSSKTNKHRIVSKANPNIGSGRRDQYGAAWPRPFYAYLQRDRIRRSHVGLRMQASEGFPVPVSYLRNNQHLILSFHDDFKHFFLMLIHIIHIPFQSKRTFSSLILNPIIIVLTYLQHDSEL